MRWLVAVVALALVAGCTASRETREGADALADALGTPDWAGSVEVETGLDGQFADEVLVTVRLGSSATAAEVADFVVALPAAALDAGLDRPSLHRLDVVAAEGALLHVDWRSTVDADEVRRGVTEWLGLAPVLGDQAVTTLRSDGGAAYVVTMGDGPRSAVRSRVEDAVAHSEPDSAWQFVATAGGLALDFATAARPTRDQVVVWDSLGAALDALPAELPAQGLSLHLLDRTVADLTLTAAEGTTDDSFSLDSYGDDVWPTVRPQLAALAGVPDAWTYTASWATPSAPYGSHLFLSLLSDQDPVDNGDEATRWSEAAQQYVHGL